MKSKRILWAAAILGLLFSSGVSNVNAQVWLAPVGLDGSWIGMGTITSPAPAAGTQFPFMDTYNRSLQSGRTGTVVCFMPPGFVNVAGVRYSVASFGQGNWVRVAPGHYTFTIARLVMNDAGQAVLLGKFRGDIHLVDRNTFEGTVKVGYYDWNQNLLKTVEANVTATRIAVEE